MSIDISRTVPPSMNTDPIKPTQPIPPKSTTVKTDKPRPHVCGTCTRSFARLEHLKRHERSHTKEKPFQCPVCERCFARRDLLLRHKQKLHADFPDETTKSRGGGSKKGKRGSKSASTPAGVGTGNSTATDLASSEASSVTNNSESPPTLYSDLLRNKVQKSGTRSRTMSFSAASATSYSTNKEIENFNQQFHPSAPPQVGFSTPQLLPATFSDSSDSNPFDDFFTASDPLFINPQLLGSDRNNSVSSNHQYPQLNQHPNFLHDRNGSHQQQQQHTPQDPHSVLNFDHDDLSWLSSPHHQSHHGHNPSVSAVPPSNTTPQSILNGSSDFHGNNPESPLSLQQSKPISPHDMFNMAFHDHQPHHTTNSTTTNNHTNFDLNIPDESFWKLDQHHQQQQQQHNQDGHGSHVITPQLRLHILTTLSTPTPFSSNPPPHLPSTLELQRYINAYIENFSKHMPFLHHTLEFTPDNVPLALDMAAVGALYAFEQSNAASIFEISRSCIHVYLESKHDHRAATSDANDINNFIPKPSAAASTPLWLVQALVLGVIYGLFSGDPTANEIAVAQANAVVSLAKSAGLHLSPLNFITMPDIKTCSIDERWKFFVAVQERIRTMHVVHTLSCLLATSYNVMPSLKNEDIKCGTPCDESLWTAPNAASWWEIMKKKELDGSLRDGSQGAPFGDYLKQLVSGQTLVNKVPQFALLSLMYGLHLEIHERKLRHDTETPAIKDEHAMEVDDREDGKPVHKKRRCSTLNAPDTVMYLNQERENCEREKQWLNSQKIPIESMLRAWETTWSLSPLASLNPSSQYGPLMSDSIPLSSLAHIRTYVDLRKVKENFWKRDFKTMGKELDNIKVPIISIEEEGVHKDFNGLLEATSYAADTISLWEKHSVKWTLETSVSQTFIHTIVSLFDCGLVMSEFLKRLEQKHSTEWTEEESSLVSRIVKIFQRVMEVVGNEDIDTSAIGETTKKDDELSTVLDLDSKRRGQKGLSILVLKVVGKILSKSYVWPFALVMGRALEARSEQLGS